MHGVEPDGTRGDAHAVRCTHKPLLVGFSVQRTTRALSGRSSSLASCIARDQLALNLAVVPNRREIMSSLLLPPGGWEKTLGEGT